MSEQKKNKIKFNSFQKGVIVIIFAIWTPLQPLSVFESIPLDIRINIFFWKNILGAVLVVFGLGIIFINLPRKKHLNVDIKLLIVGLLFPIYVVFNSLFQGRVQSFEEIILFFLWTIAAYLVFPIFFADEKFCAVILGVIFVSNLIAVLVGMWLGWSNVPFSYWLNFNFRLRFDFINPNLLATSWQISIPIALYLFLKIKHPSIKIVTVLFVCAALFFIVQARARTSTFFSLTVLVIYILTNQKTDKLLRISLSCIILSIGLLFMSQYFNYDYDDVNAISSGRLNLWEDTIDLNFKNESSWKFLTGLTRFEIPSYMQRAIRGGYQASRGHVDNVYLGFLLQHGLIGSVLFFGPIIFIVLQMLRAVSLAKGEVNRIIWIAIACWLGTLVQATGRAILPSFGNVVNIFLLPLSAYAYGQSTELLRKRKDSRRKNFQSSTLKPFIDFPATVQRLSVIEIEQYIEQGDGFSNEKIVTSREESYLKKESYRLFVELGWLKG